MPRNLLLLVVMMSVGAAMMWGWDRSAIAPVKKETLPKPEFTGSCNFYHGEHSIHCTYAWYESPDLEGKDRLVIMAQTDKGPVTSELQWDRGDRYFYYAEHEFDGLCIHWFQGAGSTGLSVIALDKDFKAHEIFHDRCRFGYQILDVMGDHTPEICAGVGNLYEEDQMEVYQWDGKTFKQTNVIKTYVPHKYDIHAVTTEPADGRYDIHAVTTQPAGQ